MAFLGDLIVKMGANISPFRTAVKKAHDMTRTLTKSLTDMRTTAAVFAKLAASIKATNTQMDRLINVSKQALAATQSLSAVELSQSRLRLQQLKMIQSQQQHNMKMQQLQAGGGGGSMMAAGFAGGIGGALTNGITGAMSSGVGALTDMGLKVVDLAANAEVMRIEFETLLGDVQKGTKMFGEIEAFALRTSFDLDSAAQAARGMLATGVKESELVGTMQLIGDLAMGDANKLALVSKAYTDVLSKGKLQAQELRQFAENGVNIRQALMDMLGKTSNEITEMSENGEISFGVMQNALISLTSEGGRFYKSMEKRNATFKGQWDALTETIAGFGRDLGALVLPSLKSIVEKANDFAQAFRAMEDKPKFLSDLLDASLSVAFESIKENWNKMLNEMIDSAMAAGKAIAHNLDPATAIGGFIGGKIGKAIGGPDAAPGQTPLDAAKANLAEVMSRLNPAANQPPAFNPLQPQENAVPGAKLAELAGGVVESAKGLFDRAALAAASKFESAKLTANWFAKTAENLLGDTMKDPGDAEDKKENRKTETQFAGAMQRGSAEAYSTIVAAMRGNKDPQVKAIDKSTKAIVAAVKGNKPQNVNVVSAFA